MITEVTIDIDIDEAFNSLNYMEQAGNICRLLRMDVKIINTLKTNDYECICL